MRAIVLCALVAVASAQLQASNLGTAKKGCDFGIPLKSGDIGWVKVDCDKTNQEAKTVGLGSGAEFLGSSKLVSFHIIRKIRFIYFADRDCFRATSWSMVSEVSNSLLWEFQSLFHQYQSRRDFNSATVSLSERICWQRNVCHPRKG